MLPSAFVPVLTGQVVLMALPACAAAIPAAARIPRTALQRVNLMASSSSVNQMTVINTTNKPPAFIPCRARRLSPTEGLGRPGDGAELVLGDPGGGDGVV